MHKPSESSLQVSPSELVQEKKMRSQQWLHQTCGKYWNQGGLENIIQIQERGPTIITAWKLMERQTCLPAITAIIVEGYSKGRALTNSCGKWSNNADYWECIWAGQHQDTIQEKWLSTFKDLDNSWTYNVHTDAFLIYNVYTDIYFEI